MFEWEPQPPIVSFNISTRWSLFTFTLLIVCHGFNVVELDTVTNFLLQYILLINENFLESVSSVHWDSLFHGEDSSG